MRRIFAATLIAVSVAACSTTPKDEDAFRKPEVSAKAPTQVSNTAFQETNGAVNLVFDEAANWISLSSIGVADIPDDSAAAQENAISIATLRAKRNISEFLNNSMKSTKTVEGVAKSHQRSIARSNKETISQDSEAEDSASNKGGEISESSHRFGQTVNEKIVDSSNAILKGVRITQQQISGDRAVVLLEVSQQSIATAKNIQRQMSGMMTK